MITTTEPIFKSVNHAIRISFLAENVQRGAKCNLARLIDQANEKYGIEEVQERTVNWGGLNDLEKTAQCAMIRNACNRLYPELKNYTLAKYSHNPMEAIPAMKRVAENIEYLLKINIMPAIFHMAICAVRGAGKSAGQIARQYRISRGYVQQDIHRIKQYSFEQDNLVREKFYKAFVGEGIIPGD